MKAAVIEARPAKGRSGRLPRWVGRVLFWSAAPVIGYVVVGAWLAWMFLHPPRQRGHGSPADYGLAFEPVTLTAPDGVKLAGWYVPCAGAHAGIVVCHGYGASRKIRKGLVPSLHPA